MAETNIGSIRDIGTTIPKHRNHTMKISCILPIGPLWRMSYQYNCIMAIENAVQYYDHVYILSSSRETRELPVSSPKITFVSDETTWWPLDEEGREHVRMTDDFSYMDRGIASARDNGDAFLLLIELNQYIDAENAERLRAYCARLQRASLPFGHRYKAFQMKEYISYPNMRTPWLFNLQHPLSKTMRLKPDAITVDGREYRAERGRFRFAPFCVTDIFPAIYTEKDYVEKFHYSMKYTAYYYGLEPVCNWEQFVAMCNNKVNSQKINPHAKLSDWGRRVIADIPPQSIYDSLDFRFDNIRGAESFFTKICIPGLRGRLSRLLSKQYQKVVCWLKARWGTSNKDV